VKRMKQKSRHYEINLIHTLNILHSHGRQRGIHVAICMGVGSVLPPSISVFNDTRSEQ
jgi:hypothetical protein